MHVVDSDHVLPNDVLADEFLDKKARQEALRQGRRHEVTMIALEYEVSDTRFRHYTSLWCVVPQEHIEAPVRCGAQGAMHALPGGVVRGACICFIGYQRP